MITPIFGWLKGYYFDNNSHFINQLIEQIFTHYNVSQFIDSVSYLSIIDLMKRVV